MGLLSTDRANQEGMLAKLFKNYSNFVNILCFSLAISAAIALVTEYFVDKTYFSDNALLPGLVKREFNQQSYLDKVYQDLKNEAELSADRPPHQFLYNQFRSIGLHAYYHNYTLRYPFGDKQVISGKNVYGILRAPRAPATEAIIISAPYRPMNSSLETTIPGLALMFALAKYFSTKNYWAKDIVFVIGDHELLGIYSWLEAYHEGEKSRVLDYGYLPARSGQIQGALNLEIHGTEHSRLEIKIEGLNGQLPNLDLFNVAVELTTRESVTPTFHGNSHPFSPDPYEIAKEYALTTASMMVAQAKNFPTGAHGLFHKYAIQALTLEGIKKSGNEKGYLSVSLHQLGLVVEGIVRSLNNLLERFNRSYWFYLLPSTRRYVSIGYYMIPFGLMAAPLLVKSLNLLLTSENLDDSSDSRQESSFWAALEFNFYCHLLGLTLASMPWFFQHYSHLHDEFIFNYQHAIHWSIITLSLLFMINPLVPGVGSRKRKKAHRTVALLDLALLLSCISLLNISLAFFLTSIYVPSVLLIGGSFRGFFSALRNLISLVLLIIIHPLSLLYMSMLATSFWFDRDAPIESHLNRSFVNHRQAIVSLIEDWYIYGNWTFFFGCAFLFPVWLQFWYLI